MARKTSNNRRPDRKNVRNSSRDRSLDRSRDPELNSDLYSDYNDEYEAVYEVYNDDFGPDYDLREYEREIEREKDRERARDAERESSRDRNAERNTRKKPDSRKGEKGNKSSGKKPEKSAKKPDRHKKNRPQSKPPVTGRDEDMLSEFSDDTNSFYTDEHSKRKNRENELKKQKKKTEKRKPMSPSRRKMIRVFSYAAIITVVIVIGIVLSLTVLFKTQVYDITGNTRYTETEITEASGISIGDNIFLAPKSAAEKNIKDKFPYIEDVSVGISIPDTIKIDITEAVEGYLIKLSDTDYLVISSKGRILERTSDRSAFKLPIFIGPTPITGEPGEYVSYEDDKVVAMIDSVTQTFADNGYTGITEIDATNMGDISFTYDNRIKVKLGIPEELDYKIRTAMTIIVEKLDSNQTGTTQGILDVSRCNSTRRSYFNEQQIAPTTVTPNSTQPSTQPSDSGGEDYSADDGSGEDYSEGEGSGEDYSDGESSDGDWTYEEGDWSGEYSDDGEN